jgi:DNA-binding NtrC family response regulator
MKNGYIRIQTPTGWKYEHHYIWEQHNGPVPNGFVIHHKNGNKTDNRIENLEILPKRKHDSFTSLNFWNDVRDKNRSAPLNSRRKSFNKELLLALLEREKSIRQVAKILGVSHHTISRNLKSMGLSIQFNRKTHITTVN